MTNAELIALVRRPGKVEMPVLSPHGAEHLIVEKADLLNWLDKGDPHGKAPWTVILTHEDGTRRLDLND